MSRHPGQTAVLFCLGLGIVISCSNPETTGGLTKTTQRCGVDSVASSLENKNRLVKMYSQAIEEYLKAVRKNNNVKYDTLFFGRHVDFPDIDLPATIKGTKIFVLSSEEIEANKRLYNKSAPYINLIGWVNNDKAEFVAVTFFPEFRHQYDYFINYKYNAELKNFQLEELAYETYVDEKKPTHTVIYQKVK